MPEECDTPHAAQTGGVFTQIRKKDAGFERSLKNDSIGKTPVHGVDFQTKFTYQVREGSFAQSVL